MEQIANPGEVMGFHQQVDCRWLLMVITGLATCDVPPVNLVRHINPFENTDQLYVAVTADGGHHRLLAAHLCGFDIMGNVIHEEIGFDPPFRTNHTPIKNIVIAQLPQAELARRIETKQAQGAQYNWETLDMHLTVPAFWELIRQMM